MRIAVTGATGNVGTALLRQLADEPDIEVVGIARRLPPADTSPYEGVEWHSIDLGEPSSLEPLTEVFKGVDAVVHLAWQIQPSQRRARLRRTNLTGTRRVMCAMRDAGVRKIVYASSVAAYAPGPKDRRVDEGWPTTGIGVSGYSADKAAVEAFLEGCEWDQPDLQLIRLRTALVFQHDAGAQVTRYFLGRHTLRALLGPGRVRLLPGNRRLRGQVVHADDAARAYVCALRSSARGAFNIATDPVLDPWMVAEEVGATVVRTPLMLLRGLTRLAWRLHLVRTEPAWLDLTTAVPLVDCSRAERELGWRPGRDAQQTVRELMTGIAEGAGTTSAALRPASSRTRRRL
ncbi:NAD-dependent epimerase/dehydratase family protein, partial [Micromonospora zhanjiangensis]